MKVTIESGLSLGQRVSVLTDSERAIWKLGTVYKIRWNEYVRVFSYLVDMDNGERFWVLEGNVVRA